METIIMQADKRGMMKAMVLDQPGSRLRMAELPIPFPGPDQVLIRIAACGVCRTDLHIVDGELAPHKQAVIPGHQIVGIVTHAGEVAQQFRPGDRIGVAWLGQACEHCFYCKAGQENLCDAPIFTGYDRNGGYAEYAIATARYCFALPATVDDLHLAPFLCAGLIGYRAYRMTDDARRIGFYGFGAAAHLLTQIALADGKQIYACTKKGDQRSQQFARALGAVWAGDAYEVPVQLDAAILFAPAGELVPQALAAVRKAGIVVCAGIHMSDIPSFPYSLLWGERVIRSVANLTRADGDAMMNILKRIRVESQSTAYALADANQALADLRNGKIDGAAVLVP